MLCRRLALFGSTLPSTPIAARAYRSSSLIPLAEEYLLKSRIVFLTGPISDTKSSDVIDKLLFLEFQDNRKPIHLHIGSPGGSVSAVLSIYNTMKYIRSRVTTLCLGQASSMASLLLAAGAPGERRIFSNSTVMIHQPYRHMAGPAVDIGVQHILKLRECLNQIYSHHTGQPIERIEQCTERDMYMSADEAKEFGIVDEVIVPRRLAGSSNEGTKSCTDDGSAVKEQKLWFQ
ncbi:ATP-dependent Clp protease proteolytic subunit-like [Zingiber officinale]|uniref:Endopeptidase Clp n=1 Tax=Zingiber officinale TaxID=94328 RepID=A0A8J5F6T8_ZINOF|nr:ATP-dependent Clp protease proteolytic subunit-like [Zingiber officinale]KAG6480689.1 hypothetical protein ZIOFF_057274 [Zingiber officinale]